VTFQSSRVGVHGVLRPSATVRSARSSWRDSAPLDSAMPILAIIVRARDEVLDLQANLCGSGIDHEINPRILLAARAAEKKTTKGDRHA